MVQRILNVLGWIGTALVVAAVAIRVTQPDWDRYAMYMAWTGLVCVLLYPLGQWREIASQMSRRQSKYATVAVTSVLIVLGILVAVNYLSNRRNARWDLTEGSIHSLSEQSLKVLSELDAPLSMTVVDRGAQLEGYRDRLTMYDGASPRVSVEYVDGERDPLRTTQLGVTVVPTVLIAYMDRTERVTTVEEREITSAIIRAVTGAQRKVYFVQGHGERDPKGEDPSGYARVAQLLEGDNVAVETLVLTQHKEVPEDATIVAILGPTADLLDEEAESLRQYLAKGGKLLLALDPPLGERPQPLTKLTDIAREWGIDVGSNVILDVSGRSNSPSLAVAAPPYPSHPITEDYGIQSVFPLARSVTPLTGGADGRTAQAFVRTAEAAWAESDLAGLQANQEPSLNEESGDIAGPVDIAAAVSVPVATPDPNGESADPDADDEADPPQTRVAVFGDSDFAGNSLLFTVGNADLFLNTVSWLTAQENLIAIRPRERGDSRLTITQTQMDAVWWLSVAVIPALVAGAGILTWSRRRKS